MNCTNVFLVHSPNAVEIKTKINKWDLIKLACFCTANETIDKMKRQFMEWEKIFANNVTKKGLISKIYQEKKKPTLNLKIGKVLDRHFSKEDI